MWIFQRFLYILGVSTQILFASKVSKMIEIVYFSDLPFVNSSQGHQIRNKREYFEDIMLDMRVIFTF